MVHSAHMSTENPLLIAVERMRASAKERNLMVNAAPVTRSSINPSEHQPKPKQLQLWPDRVRGLPNPMARSALFTVSNKPRRDFKNQALVSTSDFTIYYTGEELRQVDEDVFLQIVHLARLKPLGEVVEVTGYQLLKALGWGTNSRDYKRLRESIERLANGRVKITFSCDGKPGYIGGMIRKVIWDGETASSTKWKIFLEAEIINLFDSDGYSLILWEQRLGLRDLAKWLLSFYYTHAEPYPYKVETIYRMCGSSAKSLNHFRADLKVALGDLKKAEFLRDWEIDKNDLVSVARNQSLVLRAKA